MQRIIFSFYMIVLVVLFSKTLYAVTIEEYIDELINGTFFELSLLASILLFFGVITHKVSSKILSLAKINIVLTILVILLIVINFITDHIIMEHKKEQIFNELLKKNIYT